ncbi:MAG: 30S ribosomal protein S7 [Parcubacteria group bacterium GW2011_GWF2_39_8b]|uniref:Small ribosomal subunit protein uS7 n=3 Tax=Candidatus Zambryskiibacteriota TaxID=1817925 RepID=A0A1G2T781_9BACT|nr:MAG: 30S ribosomal protein S7 [Parcubacteria group bacterium GW2011_GWF2_39_8b]KKR46186.1 MAG: 30S ribosomal protein S7 [Parcubacteria group bacterium GW2011_GWA2_40_14]OHA93110.1 MAG: 30S ribosomal protein S7 [Candidatus Zambryskibacteria bacterium RIFCSPHIGHO2_02_38_10.5]OHA95670.1 MAG: 30S ribosomal protein S7 [Candidatus Zambryskibacteria bacterium RIFCSPHIGHO2_02_FULL_39_82]OHA98606.1 MAG: 30S ribosomal protein S7 [Candidatus Zambryskibacteria bacterium RIFCSPHIGHO2_12_FULL_38_37]OHB09
MRRKVINRNIVGKDIEFNSEKVGKFINYVMERGQKETARKIVYDAFEIIKDKALATKEATIADALEIFETALKNTGPLTEVRSRRVGGANYQIPREVRPERRVFLSMKWIIDSARDGKGKPMAKKLADEIILASKNEGKAVKKREDTHKMAEANKAFAHFAW